VVNTSEVIQRATAHLLTLAGHEFDVLSVSKPVSSAAAVNLSRVISKLSPLLGNLIEFNTVEFLNMKEEFQDLGKWKRQDPGFPDTIFEGITPTPGFEIKAWFPLATEITARFKDSQKHFENDNTYVAMLAWLPEYVIFGQPKIVDVCVVSGRSVAEARDAHYHRPPYYLVIEPRDTSARTANLQQTNTAGYVWQGSRDGKEFREAVEIVKGWGEGGESYSSAEEYQRRLAELMGRYSYRLDTNFAKMDRIVHVELEAFKRKVCTTKYCGMTILEWNVLLNRGSDTAVKAALEKHLGIKEEIVDSPLAEDE
jgi:hypothetical protein